MSARAWFGFAAVSVLWGIPYLFIRIAVDDGVPPAFLAWIRLVIGAAILLPLAWRLGLLGAGRGRARWFWLYALGEMAIPFPLINAGERHVSSSIAAILIAAVPLIVALFAMLGFDESERVRGWRLVGLFVGFAGVVCLVGVDIGGSGDELLGAAAILVAAIGYAAAPMLLKAKLSDVDPRAIMGISLTLAAIMLTPFAAIAPPEAMPSTDALIAIVVLGVFCTAAAFVLFGALVVEIGAGRALVITYVAPLVAVLAGVAVLDERPGPGAIAGLLLILAGSWLSTGGRPPPGVAHWVRRRRSGRSPHSRRPQPGEGAP